MKRLKFLFSFFQNLALSNLFERWFCYAGFGHRTKLIPSASPFPDSEAKDLDLRVATALKGLRGVENRLFFITDSVGIWRTGRHSPIKNSWEYPAKYRDFWLVIVLFKLPRKYKIYICHLHQSTIRLRNIFCSQRYRSHQWGAAVENREYNVRYLPGPDS